MDPDSEYASNLSFTVFGIHALRAPVQERHHVYSVRVHRLAKIYNETDWDLPRYMATHDSHNKFWACDAELTAFSACRTSFFLLEIQVWAWSQRFLIRNRSLHFYYFIFIYLCHVRLYTYTISYTSYMTLAIHKHILVLLIVCIYLRTSTSVWFIHSDL